MGLIDSLMSNWIKPIVSAIIIVAIVVGTFFLIYKLWKKIFKGFKFWYKYKLRKKEFEDADVMICLTAVNEKYTNSQFLHYLCMKNYSEKKIKLLMYIFKEIQSMKGGMK